jgi:quercetin dioxygenase-like cupin family protein
MQRNRFIFSAMALLAAPFTAFSKNQLNKKRTGKGFKTAAAEGRLHGHIILKGINSNVLDTKISGSDNDGGFALFEQTSLSPGRGTPLHVHHLQDEVFYVIEGAYYFQVGNDKFHLAAGDSIFLPMKVPHAWTQLSEKGKMTVLFQPAGKMESFFTTVAALKKEPTGGEMAKIFAANDMQIVGPPLKIEYFHGKNLWLLALFSYKYRYMVFFCASCITFLNCMTGGDSF